MIDVARLNLQPRPFQWSIAQATRCTSRGYAGE